MYQILHLPYRRLTTLRSAHAVSRHLQSPYRILRGLSSQSSNDGNEQEGEDINDRIEESESTDKIHPESTEHAADHNDPDVQRSPDFSETAALFTGTKIHRETGRKLRPSKEKWLLRQVVAERLKGLRDGVEQPLSDGPNKNDRQRFQSPRQFSIICPNPKLTEKGDVIDAVQANRMPEELWHSDWRGPEQALVILATPSFAQWLEDDTFFIPRVLKALTYRDTGKKTSIIVVAAVVDGLAPTPGEVPVAEHLGCLEGLSFLYGQRADLLSPKNVFDPPSLKTTTAGPGKLSHLIICGTDKLDRAAITVPLANTLFVNGTHSTLTATLWQRGQSQILFEKLRSENKQYQQINVFRSGNYMVPPMFIPSVPLTPARRITSGLGNIVRQINFGAGVGDDSSGPASQELESQVVKYINYSKANTNIGVWALIYRKELVGLNFRGGFVPPPSIERLWDRERENSRLVGLRLASGAILCRVLSGGGGWGIKQGLLSLDPQVNYEKIEEARFDMSPGASEQEQQDTALGDLARRGDWIQFFTVNPTKAKEHAIKGSEALDLHYWQDSIISERLAIPYTADAISWMKSAVFGAVPSTIDKMPDDHGGISPKKGLVFQQGHFGAVSESGFFLRSEQRLRKGFQGKVVMTSDFRNYDTKIDIPHSYVYRNLSLNSQAAFRFRRTATRPRFIAGDPNIPRPIR